MRRTLLIGSVLAAVLGAGTPAMAQAAAPVTAQASAEAYERDRQSILAQAGDYRVRFDMRESISFDPAYEPLEPKTSGGFEIVRVVYDRGDEISLQHILVMEHGGETMVIKHWRQDWVYQPETVLTYAGPNQWTVSPVAEGERRGAWSQTVWQTDDSPRYGGVGRWDYAQGAAIWTSGPTWRPLARRDAVRTDRPYDRYVGENRHALYPQGWVHLQDNMKLEGDRAIVQEDVVNTYRRSEEFAPKAGDDYWAATAAYWQVVRDAWDAVAARTGGIRLEEEAQRGSVTGKELMDWADEVQAGTLTTEAASERARARIAQATAG